MLAAAVLGFSIADAFATLTSISLPILSCQEDTTVVKDGGNLTYVVDGGFSRWNGTPCGWVGSTTGGQTGQTLDCASAGVPRKTGMFFIGTKVGNTAWDVHQQTSSIEDDASTTILLTENCLAGASQRNVYSGNIVTNWATAHPNFIMFLTSDNVCNQGACLKTSDLATPGGTTEGAGWARANDATTYEIINYRIRRRGQVGKGTVGVESLWIVDRARRRRSGEVPGRHLQKAGRSLRREGV